jgi:hypothetical protein
MLSSPSDCKIKPTALCDDVVSSSAGLSPAKGGCPEKIPLALCTSLATQSAMMQVSGEGEASSVRIRALPNGFVLQTKWEGTFNTEYCWRKARRNHLEILNPAQGKKNKDRHLEWLSYKNIMDWMARAKLFLIDFGMAKDEPGLIHGVMSEILLIHPDDVNLFITTDEMHHPFSNEGNKGESTAIRYSTNLFKCSGEQCVASNSHTAGVYGTTGAGYPMPCLFVMSSTAKEVENFQINPAVCMGLPLVRARYDDDVACMDYPSHIAVRHMSSVDTKVSDIAC